MELKHEPLFHEPVERINCRFGEYIEIGTMSFLENTEMGDYSYCCQFCFIQNAIIGKFGNIAAAVRIGPTKHPIHRPSQHHFTYRRKLYGFAERDDEEFFRRRAVQITRIGHDTWIGHGAVIMPGVTVETGSVIGAGAVVTRDVPPYSVAAGVPATVVKERFPENVAQMLMEIAWWDWSHETIRTRLDDFTGNVDAFVDKYGTT